MSITIVHIDELIRFEYSEVHKLSPIVILVDDYNSTFSVIKNRYETNLDEEYPLDCLDDVVVDLLKLEREMV
jgi:hypothetical protein